MFVFKKAVADLFSIKGPRSIYVYSCLIGVLAGLGALGFQSALQFVEHCILTESLGYNPNESQSSLSFSGLGKIPAWAVVFLPAMGGLVSGIVSTFFCKEAAGGGTNSLIYAFHHDDGKIRGKVPFYKALATVFTLGFGGSGGKEGPTAQMGAGFGSSLGSLLGVGARARRTLMLAGTAGGLGAIFQAPLGGAVTAVEMVYKEDIESDSLVPCILSSVTAYLVYTGLMGRGHIFHLPRKIEFNYQQIPFYIVLAFLCYIFGVFYIKAYQKIETMFESFKIPIILKPALGGLCVGLIALSFPEILGSGFGVLQNAISSEIVHSVRWELSGAFFFLGLAFLKVISASLTVGSGGSAGLLGPSFFIGGMLGGFLGTVFQELFPSAQIQIFPFLLLGMGSFFAGVASAPIAGMIMVSDMMGSYELLPILMLVSVLVAILSGKMSIYKHQIKNRFLSPAHHWDMNQDVMDRIKIADHFSSFRKFAVIPERTLLTDLHAKAPSIQASDFVLVSENNEYKGIISLRKSRAVPEDLNSIAKLITCEELAERVKPVSPQNFLGEAIRILLDADVDKLAIVEEGKCLGYLRYIDLIQAYQEEIRLNSRKEN